MKCSGTVELPPGAGIELFTPEGERDWVPGWDPVYPDRGGTVFLTHDTVWVVAESSAAQVKYARVTPGKRAGLVTVTVEGSRAKVTYELSALSPDEDLASFETSYDEMLAGWERHIKEAARR